jgi:hypothetical protein
VADQGLAGIGEADVPVIAVQKAGARFLLERRDLLADGGLREVERVSGSRERALLGNLAKDPQSLYVKHKTS